MLWLIPFDGVKLPVPLPVDSTLDRFFLPLIIGSAVAVWASRQTPARSHFRPTVVDLAIILFGGLCVMSVLANVETLTILGEYELGLKKLAILFSYMALFYVVVSIVQPSELGAFSFLLLALATVTALGVIYEYRTGTNLFYTWTDRFLPGPISVSAPPSDPVYGRELIHGPTVHAIALATILAMALPFAFTGLMRTKNMRDKLVYAAVITLLLAASFSTIRKTGVVGPAAALAALIVYRPRQMIRLLPLGVGVVLAIQLLSPNAISGIKSQFVGGFADNPSTQGRTDDYDVVKPDITHHLPFGRGYGTYDPEVYRFLDNEYLGRAVETGFIGVLGYLLLIAAVIIVGHRAGRSPDPVRASVGAAAVAAAVAYGVANVVFDALAFPQAPYLFFFIAGLAVVAARPDDESAVRMAPHHARPRTRERASRRVTLLMPGDGPDLSIIMVTHNGRERAVETLRSAGARVGDISVEWLVVDCGSTDGTPEALEAEFHNARVLRRSNIGFAAGNNVALLEAKGRYVLLLNPDVTIARGRLADVVAALDERPSVGAASVVQCSSDGSIQLSIRRFPSAARQLGEALKLSQVPGLHRLQEPETRLRMYARETKVDWVVGAFLVVRSDVVRYVGGLDERFFLYSEETDWCYRIRKAGWDIHHLPVMRVVHHLGGYQNKDLAVQLTYSKLLFVHKHFGPVERYATIVLLLARHSVRVVAFSLRAGPVARERRARELAALAVVAGRAAPPFSRAPSRVGHDPTEGSRDEAT